MQSFSKTMYRKDHAGHDFSKAPIVSKYYGGGGAGGAGAEDDEEEAHDELWGGSGRELSRNLAPGGPKNDEPLGRKALGSTHEKRRSNIVACRAIHA